MAASYCQVRERLDALVEEKRCRFYEINDMGFEETVVRDGSPRRAYGLSELLADAESTFGLESGELRSLAGETWLYYHDLIRAIVDSPRVQLPSPRAGDERRAAAAFAEAEALYQRNEHEAAGERLRAACREAPYAAAHSLLSVLHHQRWLEQHSSLEGDELDRAHVEIATALSLDSNDATHWMRSGNVLRARRRWDEAVDAYEQALRRAPRAAALRYNLGLIHEEAGRIREAMRDYEAFCADGASYPEALADAQERLARLRDAH